MQYPDWLMKAKESKKLLQWIQDPVHSFKMFHGRLLLKCQEEDCIVFYAVDSKEKDCLQLKEPKLCGVLYLPDYFLYEVDTAFYEAVGIIFAVIKGGTGGVELFKVGHISEE